MTNERFIIDMEHHYVPIEALKLVGKTREQDHTIGLKRVPNVASRIFVE